MKIVTETERLIIREILLQDVDAMFELQADPEVHRFLGNKTIATKDEAVSIIDFIRKQYADYGVGRWAIIDRSSNGFLGWTGLEFVVKETNKHKDYYDLGYRLIRRFWGQGIATESALASLDYAFDKLQAREVYAIADCKNDGSNSVLKKVGLKFIETFDHEGVVHNWYEVKR
ncbi:GNAT family N-acetyltransferase [Pseudochryseolinea flava]|uniref:GNAT family N-acetyltransferase n=1 Tax=Pseudochryseolinea flava TaxID=2059302 RepID=A0A364XVA1_9BACT|nr:GNAT family N-acetyltransferase [Pseudochryseolinea flava]RAV98035.1 GNAT family N-acetyltransferase [Pseudochryseolinea flava]